MSGSSRRFTVMRIAASAVIVLLALLPAAAFASPTIPSYSWLRVPANFAHAMGGLTFTDPGDSVPTVHTYTNTLEAFEQNYDKGYRIFEVDLIPTADNRLVARHDWSPSLYSALGESYPGHVPTHNQFMATKVFGKYTPLDIERIVKLMRDHRDMYIITDTKLVDGPGIKNEFRLLRAAMGKDANDLCKRVIVQIYNEPMIYTVRGVYNFPNILYTLYQVRLTQSASSGAVRFARAHGLKVVTFDTKRYSQSFVNEVRAAGLAPAVNTIDSASTSKSMRDGGVRFFYSNSLPPRPYWQVTFGTPLVTPLSPRAIPFMEDD